MSDIPELRLERARISLEGLSVGDAFGERFFVLPAALRVLIGERALPAPPWRFTDDTQMALSIVATLRGHGAIDQDALARSFGKHYSIDRGYGPAMHRLLPAIRSRKHWKREAHALFGGQGSWGNGAAMRVAPVGAYFADDLAQAVEHAARSAEVTHAHAEAAAGAVAVAVAAARASQLRQDGVKQLQPVALLDGILAHVPDSEVRERIVEARELPPETTVLGAAAALGSGQDISSQDTVPFTLWCAAHHLGSFEDALWATVSGLGDRDTTCAIVGGIVACYTGIEGIPQEWRKAREALPEWED